MPGVGDKSDRRPVPFRLCRRCGGSRNDKLIPCVTPPDHCVSSSSCRPHRQDARKKQDDLADRSREFDHSGTWAERAATGCNCRRSKKPDADTLLIHRLGNMRSKRQRQNRAIAKTTVIADCTISDALIETPQEIEEASRQSIILPYKVSSLSLYR